MRSSQAKSDAGAQGPSSTGSTVMRSIELFAGAGGLALGIEQAGFSPLGLVEIDVDAAHTLQCNRPNWRVINADIASLSGLDLDKRLHSNAVRPFRRA